MGFFNWLKKIFGGGERKPSAPRPPAVPPNTIFVSAAPQPAGAPSAPVPPSMPVTPATPVAPARPTAPAKRAPSPKRGGSLNLDAADFLPISRQELVQGAKENQGWGNPWFGRRDLIPPADDERTKLIDRGLVTQGLLTPEELVEIHEVGAEMERVRPSLTSVQVGVQRAGEAAVQAAPRRSHRQAPRQ